MRFFVTQELATPVSVIVSEPDIVPDNLKTLQHSHYGGMLQKITFDRRSTYILESRSV